MKKFISIAFCAALACFIFAGCKSTPQPEDLRNVPEASLDPNDSGYAGGMNGGSGYGAGAGATGEWGDANSVSQQAANADADGWVVADPGNNLGFPVIYFAFNSDTLVPSETAHLDKVAQYLADKPDLGVLIEGHCDQRGTEEYNRALGERRANAIRAYLAGRGVADNMIRTISCGKDKPAIEGTGEAVWRQNRRGVLIPHYVRR